MTYTSHTHSKLALQDPADEIIRDPASLKNGVSARILLGDTDFSTQRLPMQYVYGWLACTGCMSGLHGVYEWLAGGA